MKTATTIEEQIALLESRGMVINDKEHAGKMLLSVGYYRLGFYWFCYETSQDCHNRNHNFVRDTVWEKVEALYIFDDALRSILTAYIQMIETDIRTFLTYTVSNHYKDDPVWFANSRYVTQEFVTGLEGDRGVYADIKKNEAIARHHNKYHNDKYAPAWKTIEFFTFGNVLYLFRAIKDEDVRKLVYERYGIHKERTFLSYAETLKTIRNLCAHGHIVYDTKLRIGIKTGPADLAENEDSNIRGILKVIYYMLRQIDPKKEQDLREELTTLKNDPQFDVVSKKLENIIV